MGITVGDFQVAGGVLLFVIAAMDLVTEAKFTRRLPDTVGAVPLGTPLIIGPATLTMALMLTGVYGLWETLAAVVVNIGIAGVIFMGAEGLTRLLGPAGSRAVSKVASLILAAIAIMMIRKGLPEVLTFLTTK
jgi:multiple antibiotic resistance protein